MRKFALFFGLLLGLSSWAAVALPVPYEAGQQYLRVPMPVPPGNPKKIRVQEFFWYGCPHCYHADPMIEAWSKKLPKDVVFERVPDTLGSEIGKRDQRAFYVAKTLGIVNKIHVPLFEAIHKYDEHIATMDDLRDFFVRHAGITPQQFDQTAASFTVASDMRRADQLASDYQVMGVPTFVVGGKYLTNGRFASTGRSDLTEDQSFKAMLDVVDYLINKVRLQREAK